MSDLPKVLTIEVEAWSGETKVADGRYLAYWCEECKRYRVWPGPDWGASHYFCDDCLTKMELDSTEGANNGAHLRVFRPD